MAHKLLNQIDRVKEKLTDAEYKDICDSLHSIHIEKQALFRLAFVQRSIQPSIETRSEGKGVVLSHYCRVGSSTCICTNTVNSEVCNADLFKRILNGRSIHPDTIESIQKRIDQYGVALLRTSRQREAHISCPCIMEQRDESLAIFSCDAVKR